MDNFDPHSLAASTLRGDIRDALMNQIIGMKDHYHKLAEKDQREIAGHVDSFAQDLVRKAVELVRADSTEPPVAATIEDFKVKGASVEIKCKGSVSDAVVLSLLHSRKEGVVIVPAGSHAYMGQGDSTAEDFVQPDQASLPVAEGAKTQIDEPSNPEPEPEVDTGDGAQEPNPNQEAVEPKETAEEPEDTMPADDLPEEIGPLYPLEGAMVATYGENKEAYWAGVINYNGEGSLNDNPHKGTTKVGKAWKAGWQHAARTFTENNSLAIVPEEMLPGHIPPAEAPEPQFPGGEVEASEAAGPADAGGEGVASGDPGGERPAFLDRGGPTAKDDEDLTNAL